MRYRHPVAALFGILAVTAVTGVVFALKPYAPVLSLGVLSGFFDQNGEFANLTTGLGEPQAQQVLPCDLNFTGKDFLVCSSLSDALQLVFSGGTQLLQNLVKRPGGQSLFGSLLHGAQRTQSHFDQTQQLLAKDYPFTAKMLFSPHKAGAK